MKLEWSSSALHEMMRQCVHWRPSLFHSSLSERVEIRILLCLRMSHPYSLFSHGIRWITSVTASASVGTWLNIYCLSMLWLVVERNGIFPSFDILTPPPGCTRLGCRTDNYWISDSGGLTSCCHQGLKFELLRRHERTGGSWTSGRSQPPPNNQSQG